MVNYKVTPLEWYFQWNDFFIKLTIIVNNKRKMDLNWWALKVSVI